MARIDAYLTLDGETREAMAFYQACLGGTLEIQTVGESPMAEEMPPETHRKVLHAMLQHDDLVLMAADRLGGEGGELVKGNAVNLSLNCTSKDEITAFFGNLSEGGQVIMPLEEQFWGALFGMLIDKFGMPWMLNYDMSES